MRLRRSWWQHRLSRHAVVVGLKRPGCRVRVSSSVPGRNPGTVNVRSVFFQRQRQAGQGEQGFAGAGSVFVNLFGAMTFV